MNKIDSSAEKWIQKGRRIWIQAKPNLPNQFQDAFLQAQVLDIRNKQITVNIVTTPQNNKQFKISIDDCLKLTYGPSDVPDMVDLQQLNEPQLLYNIKRRYLNDMIFTYCGPTLVIVNPYASIEKLFNDATLIEYQTFVFTDTLEYKNLPPHIFGLAAFCLWQLFQNERNQSIVISGESGAGKTQNTKYCLKFLASLGRNLKELISESKSSKKISNFSTLKNVFKKTSSAKLNGIQDKILGCNQILEAFGNAKTIRNDNSSRFGKLILLLYGETQIDIKSAFIISYLLEKSRIVSISEGQRNYHVFYYFVKGTTPEEKQEFYLKPSIKDYVYLNQSTVQSIKGVSDQKRFEELKKEFDMYISKDESNCVFRILSSILNMGNIIFKKEQTKNNEQIAVITNKEYLKNIATLLDISFEQFQKCFQFKTRKMGVSVINSPLKYDEAIALKDSFCKNIYERNFMFLVTKLNEKIELQKINLDQNNKSYRKSIGLLDIFGFQVLTINSLEQFFINFANEKLQQLYVSYIFKEEQNQFLKQGLKQFSHDIGFQDNKPIIDLFELYPLGIFHLVNESSELNKPDENLPESIIKSHANNKFVAIPKAKKSLFSITHSCSPVTYNTNGFTARNKDEFPQQILEVIANSKNEAMKRIIIGQIKEADTKSRSASKKFLGSKFLNQMNKLTEQLYSCDCHFVRCIKPNSYKSPKLFNSEAVLQSLRYLGVLDSIIIRKLGYIYRRPFKEFVKKFFEIDQYIFNFPNFTKDKTEDDFKEQCKKMIQKHAPKFLQNKEILFGLKKILVRESALNHLEFLVKEKRKLRIQSTNKIKAMYRKSVFRRTVRLGLLRFKVLKGFLQTIAERVRQRIKIKKCIKIQNAVKKFLFQKRLEKIKEQATKSVTIISAYYKMKKNRQKFLLIRKNTKKLQANIRFFLKMKQFLRQKACQQATKEIFEQTWAKIQNKSAILIQKQAKGYIIRRKYKQILAEIRKKLRLSKFKDRLVKVVSLERYNRFKQFLMKYKRPIIKLQSIVKGRLTRKAFLLMKKSAIIIQKAFKNHQKKKYYLIRLWKQYKKNLFVRQNLKIKELSQLGVTPFLQKQMKNYSETVGMRVQMSPNQLLSKYRNQIQQTSKINWSINQSIQFNQKNTFQTYIADVDLIGNEISQGRWIESYTKAKDQLKKRNEYPIYVTFSEQLTHLISNKQKIYSVHYRSQDLNVEKIELNNMPQTITLNQGYSIAKMMDGAIYSWGIDYQNALLNSESKALAKQFCENKVFRKNEFVLFNCKYKQIQYVNEEGKVYQKSKQLLKSDLKLVDFRGKVSIKSIASSNFFIHFLTSTGQIYSKGTNQKGQLGLGFTSKKQILQPQINTFFKNSKEIIESISVGIGHTVVKSRLGYVYGWGNNCYQQIASENYEYVHTPLQIESEEGLKTKAFQIVAGARSTYILTQNLKIMGLGTSSSFPAGKSSKPFQLQLLRESCLNKNLLQIKLNAKWSDEISILFVNAIDHTKCKAGTKSDIILKYSKMIAKEWIDDTTYPPYHEWADNILQLGDLRKLKFGATNRAPTNKKKNDKENPLEQLKILMDLRKTSTLFKTAAKKKMQEIILMLSSKQPQKWTPQQKELNTYIKQNSQLIFK